MKNTNIKNLVVGVDLSAYSKSVVKEARELASKMKVPLTFVLVAEDVFILSREYKVDKLEVSAYHTQVVRKKYRLSKSEKVVIEYGDPDKGILKVAKSLPSPMIVVGHRGHNKVLKFFLGSTAETLVFQSPYPVWIHRGDRKVLPKRILVPSDLSARSCKTYDSLKNIRQLFKSKSEMYHVIAEPLRVIETGVFTYMYNQIEEDSLEKVKKFRKTHPDLKIEKALGDVTYKIRDRAKKFDVIALTPRKPHKSNWPTGSVTSKLLRTCEKPILVVPV